MSPSAAAPSGQESQDASRVPASTSPALVFRLGGRDLAAILSSGARVVDIDSWTRIPTAPPYVLGLVNSKGRVLSVIDIREELGLPGQPWSLPVRALELGSDALRVAVAIEEVLGYERFDPARAGDEDPVGALGGYGKGKVELAGQQATLVDLLALVDSLRLRKTTG